MRSMLAIACVLAATQCSTHAKKSEAFMPSHQYTESYKGMQITIQTTPNPDGTWNGTARIEQTPFQAPVQAERFATEDEARRHALSMAAESVDRTRTLIGKP
jgi:hypothetical protein